MKEIAEVSPGVSGSKTVNRIEAKDLTLRQRLEQKGYVLPPAELTHEPETVRTAVVWCPVRRRFFVQPILS